MPQDACYKKVKRKYKVFPSARASQAIAKCRRSKGISRKSEKGASLRRWDKEKWVDTRTGKPCGSVKRGSTYCRPSRRVSSKTPRTTGEISPAQKRRGERAKAAGKRAAPLRKK